MLLFTLYMSVHCGEPDIWKVIATFNLKKTPKKPFNPAAASSPSLYVNMPVSCEIILQPESLDVRLEPNGAGINCVYVCVCARDCVPTCPSCDRLLLCKSCSDSATSLTARVSEVYNTRLVVGENYNECAKKETQKNS